MSDNDQAYAEFDEPDEQQIDEGQPKRRRSTKKQASRGSDVVRLKAPYHVTPQLDVKLALRDIPTKNGKIVRFVTGSVRTTSQNTIQINSETTDAEGNSWGYSENRGGWVRLDFTKIVG